VGPAAAHAGVHIRTGFLTASGEHVVSGLVQRLGSLDFVNDNTGCFANGSCFPKNGRIVHFGSHRVYLGTVPETRYSSVVLAAPEHQEQQLPVGRVPHRWQRRDDDGRRSRCR
jgi:hypothetical protein